MFGTLTIRGVAKEITMPVTYLGTAKDPWGNVRAGFETSATLNRKDFGLAWNAALETGGFRPRHHARCVNGHIKTGG